MKNTPSLANPSKTPPPSQRREVTDYSREVILFSTTPKIIRPKKPLLLARSCFAQFQNTWTLTSQ
ncbi:MAG: hypothetical protein NZ551_02030 [Microscillaceae bacterium]|nr:hypothetical protein [Microscillaceae bacterium]MDW8459965.1 hypothetical protein [Cytophagales bacterium]